MKANSAELALSKADLTQQLDLKSQQLEQLELQLSQQIQQHAELQTLHRQTTVRVADLGDELDSAQQRHASQSAETQTLKDQTAELAQTRTDLQQQLSEEAERASALQSAHEQEVHQREELQKRLASQAAAEETLNARVTAQEAELSSERQQISGNYCCHIVCCGARNPISMLRTKAVESCLACNSRLPIASYQMLIMRFTDVRSMMCTEEKRLHYTMQTSQPHVTNNVAY